MVDNPYKYPYVPIGGIIEWDGTGLTGAPDLSTPEKVAAVYGYGTWERYGTDRVTVGAGGEYAAGSTGGEKEHTLTTNEGPRHSHDLAIRVNKHSGDSGVTHTSIETSTGWYDIIMLLPLANPPAIHSPTTTCSPISPTTATAASRERRTL